MAKKSGLGKGLDSLIPTKKSTQTTSVSKNEHNKIETNDSNTSSIKKIKLTLIEPDKLQPRKEFNEEALNELADSIKKYGIIQPLVVAKSENGNFYKLIAGERRWRAARLAGVKEVPVIIKDFTPIETVEISIIENIQREDLNPIEEALAYARLIDEFHLTQEEVADKVSKSRVSITNSLRLLKLSKKVQDMISKGEISFGHAKVILGISDEDKQYDIAKDVVEKHLSVRETEKLLDKLKSGQTTKKNTKQFALDETYAVHYKEMEEKMKEVLGSKVSIKAKSGKKGKIEIEYYSMGDLELLFNSILSIKK